MTAGAGAYDYAQIGWWKVGGWTGPFYFTEYSNSSGLWNQQTFSAASVPSNNDFKVGSDSTTMFFVLNSVTKTTVLLSTLGWSPTEVQLLGETHDTGDQSPGSVLNPISMGTAQYKNASFVWVSAGVSEVSDLSTQANNVDPGDTSWEVWDTRY
ncbi:MAG: hypothetical protein WD907_04520 [Bacilli bacterium]